MDKRMEWIIVSGLPRSGTSMMMRMLKYGGLKLLIDENRKADEDNPKGYFEFTPTKDLSQDASWLLSRNGEVVKVISHLLRYLPPENHYKIIFMLRPIVEVLASQRKMLERDGKAVDASQQEILGEKYKDHLYRVRLWLAKRPNIDCLFLHYKNVVEEPLGAAESIREFLGRDMDAENMAQAVSPSLYRNRADGKAEK